MIGYFLNKHLIFLKLLEAHFFNQSKTPLEFVECVFFWICFILWEYVLLYDLKISAMILFHLLSR